MIPNHIGDSIRQKRKIKKWSIETLAEKSGTSIAFISRLELHTSGSVSLNRIYKVLNALELSPADVFGQPSMSRDETELWDTLRALPEHEKHEKIKAILCLLR